MSGSISKTFEFFSINRGDIALPDVVRKFTESWKEDPIKTLKILYNFRDIRNGKGHKEISRLLFLIIKLRYQELYQLILPDIIELGSWKDLLYIAQENCLKEVRMFSDQRTDDIIGACLRIMINDITDEVSFFKDQLKKDLKALAEDKNISLCAKWAPSEGSSFDKEDLLFAKKLRLALKQSPKEYRKMLSALRAKINLVETNMSGHKFDKIKFEQVPSKCHMNHRKAFNRMTNANEVEDPTRQILVDNYRTYQEQLSANKTTIKFKGLEPHEIVKHFLNTDQDDDPILEAQWSAIVADTKSSGSFKNCIAISDVSGSMAGEPLIVSVALGLLIAECCEGPYHNSFITFSSDPEIQYLKQDPKWLRSGLHVQDTDLTLKERISMISQAKWDMSTDMSKVFSLLLDIALKNKLTQSEMIEKIFILTDMEFNCAISTKSLEETGSKSRYFSEIKKLYESHGYKIPKIVFWNLRSSTTAIPFNEDDKDVALLSGFSAEMLKAVMKYGIVDPIRLMDDILSRYQLTPEIIEIIEKIKQN